MIAELIKLTREYKIVSSYTVTLIARFFSITYRLMNSIAILLILCLIVKQPDSITTLISYGDNIIMLSFAITYVLKISFFRKWGFTIPLLISYLFFSVVLLYSAPLGNLKYFTIILIIFFIYLDFITFALTQIDEEIKLIKNLQKCNDYYMTKQEVLLTMKMKVK